MATLYYASEHEKREITPANGTDFDITECYQWLECTCIEIVWLRDGSGHMLIIDESGKLENKPINPEATMIATLGLALADDDHIVGHAILCEKGQLQ